MSTTVKVKYLLDVNVLLAAIWQGHAQYQEAIAWLAGKSVILCPIAELGFLRISTNRARSQRADGKSPGPPGALCQ